MQLSEKILIWKTNDLNINIASVRYRCLFPLHYLELLGIKSCIYSKNDQIQFNGQTDIIIFVKSFTSHDLYLAEQAKKAGVSIILDICDNIFLQDYLGENTQNVAPSQIFKQMAQIASVIVTTGVTLKSVIETELGIDIPIFVIADGNETLEDVKNALFYIKWKRWAKLAIYRPISLLLIFQNVLRIAYSSIILIKKKTHLIKKKIYRFGWQIRHTVKCFIGIKPSIESGTNQCPEDLNKKEINTPILQKIDISISTIKQENREKTDQLFTNLPLLTSKMTMTGNAKKIIWFGNHGANYGNFGMLNILDISDHLIKLSREINFTLIVVSNNYEKYCSHILPLPFNTEYISWDPFNIYQYISQSDVSIVPNSKSFFSACKSANRAVLSLYLGVPVVATKTPALELFNDCIISDQWDVGLKAYLENSQLVNEHIKSARTIIQNNYSGKVIAAQWTDLLSQIN